MLTRTCNTFTHTISIYTATHLRHTHTHHSYTYMLTITHMQPSHHITTDPNTGTDRRQNARCIGAAGGKRTPFLRMEKQSPSLTPTVIPVTWQPSSGRFFVGGERAKSTRECCDARIIVHPDQEKRSKLVMKSFSLFEIH